MKPFVLEDVIDRLWHAQPGIETAQLLNVDSSAGLSSAEASARLLAHGPNALPETRRRPLWRVFLRQLARLELVAAIFKVLSEPMRRRLLDELGDGKEAGNLTESWQCCAGCIEPNEGQSAGLWMAQDGQL